MLPNILSVNHSAQAQIVIYEINNCIEMRSNVLDQNVCLHSFIVVRDSIKSLRGKELYQLQLFLDGDSHLENLGHFSSFVFYFIRSKLYGHLYGFVIISDYESLLSHLIACNLNTNQNNTRNCTLFNITDTTITNPPPMNLKMYILLTNNNKLKCEN